MSRNNTKYLIGDAEPVDLSLLSSGPKTHSSFFTPAMRKCMFENIKTYPFIKAAADKIIASAKPWLKMSNDELWALMFAPTIPRSWMVWSNGYCPSCNKDVPMYNWKINVFAEPWKLACPHCGEKFPKNDFYAFYKSGLDEHGLFKPELANRALLFNTEHPDPTDPLHKFGVDDGTGYIEGNKKWRFIGAYLIYGQWKQLILGGIKALAEAYFLSDNVQAARKAAIMLDRIADVYPDFHFNEQGEVYEKRIPYNNGYVSVWHDACEETRQLVLAYDMIFEAIRNDRELIDFLSEKAVRYKLLNPKKSFVDIQRNIEERILKDPLKNPLKIHCNYPKQRVVMAIIEAVLNWEGNKKRVMDQIKEIVTHATEIDGVTGEKGLPGYSSFTIGALGEFLGLFDRVDPDFMSNLMREKPVLKQTWRFFIDTWCLQSYYPTAGDALWFATKASVYRGMGLEMRKDFSMNPSPFSFLFKLYQLTGDVAYVQAMLSGTEYEIEENLPFDFFAEDPDKIRQEITDVVKKNGKIINLKSVRKDKWGLAILRSGNGDNARALWMDYDSGGMHAHKDGLNLGLFAHGLDILPDFGYPPVQFGGWSSDKSLWYCMTAAHNTVVVDGRDQAGLQFGSEPISGTITAWGDGKIFHVMQCDGSNLYPPLPDVGFEGCSRYERTAALVDMNNEKNFYVIDIFRIKGGKDHARFISSHFGTVSFDGISLQPEEDYGYNTQMRNFKGDSDPSPGWRVTWKISDRYNYLPENKQLGFCYIDFTRNVHVSLCEAWIVAGLYNASTETWIPRLMVRRRSHDNGLESNFVSVMETFERKSAIKSIRRLPLLSNDGREMKDSNVGLEITHLDGTVDLFILTDIKRAEENNLSAGVVFQKDWETMFDGEIAFIRRNARNKLLYISICNGSMINIAGKEFNHPGMVPNMVSMV